MRTLSAFLFMSLDGVVEAPERFLHRDAYEDLPALIGETIAGQDAVVLGRKTYDDWSAFWPDAAIEPFAGFINRTPKYVASGSPVTLAWHGSYRLAGALGPAIAALKAQPGKTIGVHGSISLVQSLLGAGLLDELRLVLVPAIAGRGRRLLSHDGDPLPMQLVSTRATAHGLHYLVYRPDLPPAADSAR